MKKWYLLTLVLLLVLSGCRGETGEPPTDGRAPEEEPKVENIISTERVAPEVWERAPELAVSDGAAATQALKCTTSWMYTKEDGTSSAYNACGDSPLGSKEFMEPLVTGSGRAWLNFELKPSSVTVQCWSAEYFGTYDVEGEPVEVEVLAADFADGTSTETYSIPLKEGGWVYEVTAKWTSSENYGGTVYYGFYTE